MALPLPVLDDRTFEEMVAEALRLAPQRAPAWTDHNLSDPGVTLVELFAWLTEMQRYRLDRLREESLVKLLGLVGMQPRPATPARAAVAVSAPQTTFLPLGTPLRLGGVSFSTEEDITVVPARLARILTSSRAGQVDETAANDGEGLSFFAFGPDAEAGSRLYLGFSEPLPAEVGFSLDLVLYEGYPAARGEHGEEPPRITPSARIEWEALSGGGWLPLEILGDETVMLSLPGRLRFRLASPLDAAELPPIPGELSWLRATVVEPGYELPPRLAAVRWQTVPAVEATDENAAADEDAEDDPGSLGLRTGAGNVDRGAAVALAGPLPGGEGLVFSLPAAATGGTDRETVDAARLRLRRDKLTLWRAVNDADFEALAKATPGLRVARTWSLSGQSLSGLTPATPTASATVTVIVVPFSEAAKPVPSSGFLRTVRCHLDRHRLLTTQVRVVGPDYVEVGVEAGLVLQAGAGRDAVLARAAAALGVFLHPLQGGPAGEGWPFGRPVYLSEVYAALEAVAGVDAVERVAVSAGAGSGVSRDERGNLLIPSTSLVFSGAHRLTVVEREGALCRVKPAPGARS